MYKIHRYISPFVLRLRTNGAIPPHPTMPSWCEQRQFYTGLFLKVLPTVTFYLLLIKWKHFKISECVSTLSFQLLHYKFSEVFNLPFRNLLHFIDYQVSSSLRKCAEIKLDGSVHFLFDWHINSMLPCHQTNSDTTFFVNEVLSVWRAEII